MKKAYQQPVTTRICIWQYNKFISDRWRLSQQSVGERWGPSWGHPLNMLILFHCVAHHMQNSHSKCQILLSTQEQVISMSIVKHTVFIVLEHNRVTTICEHCWGCRGSGRGIRMCESVAKTRKHNIGRWNTHTHSTSSDPLQGTAFGGRWMRWAWQDVYSSHNYFTFLLVFGYR